jgi:Kef-type K+ transport system membrane component KefB/Trk K+ transport system NAD-binding subunit
VGPVALATGIGQVVFTSVFGFFLTLALGFDTVPALYIAVALTFSSTIIIVKLLSDKREIDALHGRIAVGFLIVQDIAVILAMIGLAALGAAGEAENNIALTLALVVVKSLLLLALILVLMRVGLPQLVTYMSRTPELLVLFSIAWAVSLAVLGEVLGFSREVGAFLAGMSLASTPYREAIAGRLTSVRDFLLLFFFIDLGARLDLSLLGATIVPSIVLSLFVLIGNPLIVMVIMGAMGYRKRTGFLAGLTVAQISEFSLILAALGLSLGHIGDAVMGLITTVGLVTIALSTYLILYSAPIYERLAPYLRVFERHHPYRESSAEALVDSDPVDIILLGLGRYGSGIARHLRQRGRVILGVDFDPEALDRLRRDGVRVMYGDAEDPELLAHLPLDSARWVVITAPDPNTTRVLLRHLRQRGYEGNIAAACRVPDEEDTLRIEGATVVLRPFADAAEQAVDLLTSARSHVEAISGDIANVREVRVGAGSAWAGGTLSELAPRDRFGVTVLAVSRAGRGVLNPDSEFQVFPGDHLILSGTDEALARAARDITRFESHVQEEDTEPDFVIGEIAAAEHPQWHGRSLSEVRLRATTGVTVVAISRPGGDSIVPSGAHVVTPDDRLMVAGTRDDVERLRRLRA